MHAAHAEVRLVPAESVGGVHVQHANEEACADDAKRQEGAHQQPLEVRADTLGGGEDNQRELPNKEGGREPLPNKEGECAPVDLDVDEVHQPHPHGILLRPADAVDLLDQRDDLNAAPMSAGEWR